MKKTNNNRFRNGHNGHTSQIYSLNYKFDSNSVAGKFSGTALELIKRYNELARDANNNNDIVLAEIFRQYAEHYRKIVTDINDKKATRINNRNEGTETESQEAAQETAAVENSDENKEEAASAPSAEAKTKKLSIRKKEFKVIEMKEDKAASENSEKNTVAKTKKINRKTTENTAEAV